MEQQVRIDKFLWSIRVYKTRTEAADASRLPGMSRQVTPCRYARAVSVSSTG